MVQDEKGRLRRSVYYPIALSLLLWFVKAVELALSLDFGKYGILPRTLKGSTGILLSGFIHGDILHLMSNTIPLVLLGVTILYLFDKVGYQVIAILYILTGCAVWLFAREAYHIGASGLVYSMMYFLFVGGLIRRDRQSLAVSLMIMVLYGGSMFSGLFPSSPHISWESHLIGFLLGVIAAIYLRNTKMISQIASDDQIEDADIDLDSNTNATFDNENSKTTFTYHYLEKDNKDE